MYAEERRAYILAALEKRGTVHSYELAEQMGVSRETIRRDIMELSNRGLLVKTHGGAISTGNGEVLLETPLSETLFTGYTRLYVPVVVSAPGHKSGEIVRVRLGEYDGERVRAALC